jgi:hypothetical protein
MIITNAAQNICIAGVTEIYEYDKSFLSIDTSFTVEVVRELMDFLNTFAFSFWEL